MPPIIGIILFVIMVIVTISLLWTNVVGAPYVPTSMKTVHQMLDMAAVTEDDTVYDLGCGDGRILIAAARRYGASAVGIEIDPFRYVWCQLLITVLGLRKQVTVLYGNFFQHDLSVATVVTCYLLPQTNRKLDSKLKAELAPGARVVSNSFLFSTLEFESREGLVVVYRV